MPVCLRPADRVLDGCGLIPPKGGHHHGPRQSAGRAEGTAVAAMDQPVADERAERAGLLCPPRPCYRQLLQLAASGTAACRREGRVRARAGRGRRGDRQRDSAVSTILAAVAGSPMWPSTRATWSEAATSVDWVTFREVATTLKPRPTKAFTTPAPMPCEAPVTMAVFCGLLMIVTSKTGGHGSGYFTSGMPGWSAGRGPGAGQKKLRSLSAMGTSLMLASRRRIRPSSSNSHSSLP